MKLRRLQNITNFLLATASRGVRVVVIPLGLMSAGATGCSSEAVMARTDLEARSPGPVPDGGFFELLDEEGEPLCDWMSADAGAMEVVEASIQNQYALQLTGQIGEQGTVVAGYFGNFQELDSNEHTKSQTYRISFSAQRFNESVNKDNRVDILLRDRDLREAARIRLKDGQISLVNGNIVDVLGSYDASETFNHGVLIDLNRQTQTFSVSISQDGEELISNAEDPVSFNDEDFDYLWDLVIEIEPNDTAELSVPVRYLLDDLTILKTCRFGVSCGFPEVTSCGFGLRK